MLPNVKIYTVHRKPGSAPEDVRFVPEGFSWWAFLFSPIWALYHRLWLPAALIIALSVGAEYAERTGLLVEVQAAILMLGVQALFGMMGFDLIRARLARQGYAMEDITASSSQLAAEQRYFDRALAS